MIRPHARLYRFALPLALVVLCSSLAPRTLQADQSHAHPAAQQTSASEVQASHESASARTLELLTLHKRWLKAPTSERAQLHQQLLEKAEQRRQLLDELMQSHPAEVLRVAIPEDKQRGLPSEVVARLEQRLDLEGELEVLYEDYADGSAKLRHILKTPFGERFELHFAQQQRQWRSGLKVRAQGWLLERSAAASSSTQGDVALSNDENGLILLADGSATSTSTLAYDLPNTLGAQRTLAILVNFQDAPSNKPWTLSQANSLVFGDVSNFFKENSSQQTWLTGSVTGWYTIPVSSTVCDSFAIEQYAKTAAQEAGFNLGNYDRFIYIFPKNACGYSGMGQVGSLGSGAWINGSMILRTVAHELGHNLGLQHAHALDCGDTTLGGSCSTQEYGDTLDIMGYSGTVGHFNGFSKERLGWLASSNLIDVSSAGNFYLKPASAQTTGGKVLKIANGLDANGQPRYYYVEYRQPIGFDAQITDRGVVDPNNVFQGVAVHQASPSNSNSSQLLDMTAGSNSVDMKDAALTGGRSFSDSGMTLTTQWSDASQALVSVDFSGGSSTPTCTRSTPAVSVSPGQSTWLAAGSSYTFTVSVTNKDSSGCTSSSFSLSPVKPSDWSASLGSTSLSLAPGASSSTTLKITSPSAAADGFYDVGASATANGLNASGSASFVVSNPTSTTNQAPTAVNDAAQLSSITSVNVPVLANDSDPDGDKLNIVAFSQGSKGSVSLNSDGTLRYSPAKAFKSSDQFSYSISDGKSSASATVSIGLQSSSSGGGSTGGKGGGKIGR
ncbi:NPCBM-associated, NEW3 domain of alpha-galactosidase [Pseudomonas benzenivorans]|nr:Ig-like domain-containing protein [Pseudomonas benzenivorans]SDH69211.1 NPCBM-associated, NEW3 domain of alpha-galactosidase [Pseudomonas benzenivorans]